MKDWICWNLGNQPMEIKHKKVLFLHQKRFLQWQRGAHIRISKKKITRIFSYFPIKLIQLRETARGKHNAPLTIYLKWRWKSGCKYHPNLSYLLPTHKYPPLQRKPTKKNTQNAAFPISERNQPKIVNQKNNANELKY